MTALAQWQIAVQQGEWSLVAPLLDQEELEFGKTLEKDLWPFDLHILGHIYNGELPDARFVWKRTPKSAQQEPCNQAAFTLLQHLWNKEYQMRWPAMNSQHWSLHTVPLIAALASKLQAQTIVLISEAYSSISVDKASSFLGCSAKDTLNIAQAQHWESSADGMMLKIVRSTPSTAERSSIKQLQHLSQYVLQLET
ncbi:hypothetical protein WJX84_007268 [Apatococcus fuscideae]|uniref:CSN8/PSMD8/EIF3K domain-containing protein n=1 Tax=Apatococcus fuscideae TaxID=2026836 RepID=A0AAW1TA66_9CHLO